MAEQPISTRLRFIKSSSIDDLIAAIDALPFKVELKHLVKDGNKWVYTFVLPESLAIKFNNMDMD